MNLSEHSYTFAVDDVRPHRNRVRKLKREIAADRAWFWTLITVGPIAGITLAVCLWITPVITIDVLLVIVWFAMFWKVLKAMKDLIVKYFKRSRYEQDKDRD